VRRLSAFVPLLLDHGQDRSRITSYRLLVQMSEKSAPRRYGGSFWTCHSHRSEWRDRAGFNGRPD
jgi:hypothetical protein